MKCKVKKLLPFIQEGYQGLSKRASRHEEQYAQIILYYPSKNLSLNL